MNVFLWIAVTFLACAAMLALWWLIVHMLVLGWCLWRSTPEAAEPPPELAPEMSGAASGVVRAVISYRPTSAEQDPGYRSAMTDAGRGHLLP